MTTRDPQNQGPLDFNVRQAIEFYMTQRGKGKLLIFFLTTVFKESFLFVRCEFTQHIL